MRKRKIYVGAVMLVLFLVWTVLVSIVDVRPIGPQNSEVGFAGINGFFHNLTGVHMWIYVLTDWLSLVPAGIVLGFGILGLKQWIERKSILKVDYDILVLGVFYVVVFGAYILFEEIAVNYRPMLINGILEASYPSSTTMLVLCVMPTAMMQFGERVKNEKVNRYVKNAIIIFTVFMVGGRLVSGVHWLTDIIGGMMLSAGIVAIYRYALELKKK
ncbi:MAG: phosphatase PAP2 family protein [Firmicutes bacterium]|nr:phosphatase PAP2 family protein [Bacillota bacterium]